MLLGKSDDSYEKVLIRQRDAKNREKGKVWDG